MVKYLVTDLSLSEMCDYNILTDTPLPKQGNRNRGSTKNKPMLHSTEQ